MWQKLRADKQKHLFLGQAQTYTIQFKKCYIELIIFMFSYQPALTIKNQNWVLTFYIYELKLLVLNIVLFQYLKHHETSLIS